MDEKTLFAMLLEILLTVLLVVSWMCGKDGVISTAIFGLMGMTAGAIIGFKFGRD
jgi:hypothetical protein